MTFEDNQGGTGAQDNAMAALLEEETVAYPELRRGEIIEGTVVGTDRDGILVDIGAKSEGVIPPNEMQCLQPEGPSRLSTGEKILVSIVQPESQEGQVVLSLDRARGERGWRVLQDYMDANEAFEGYVTGSNKGGLLVNVEGVNAFVPLSQIVAGPERGSPENTQRALAEWVGRTVQLKVIELNRRRNRAILSERSAVQEKRAAEKERLLQELEEGDVRTGRITSIRDFGVFVDIGGADGLVHLSELSWERTPKTPQDLFNVGQEVPVYVLKVDHEAKKIALSIRRAQPERWEEIVSRYREGQVVPGQVTKLAPFGAFVRLEGPIEGLIHISELVDRRIAHPKEVVEENDVVPVKIVRIEYDRHRLGLSLKQARNQSEQDGWVFSASGGAIRAPEDALTRLELTEMPARQLAEPEPTEAPPAPEPSADNAPVAEQQQATEAPPREAPKPRPSREPEPEPISALAQAMKDAEEKAAAQAATAEATAEPEAAPEPEAEAAPEEPEAVAEPEPEAIAEEPEVAPETEETQEEPEAAPEPEAEAPAEEPEPEAAEQAVAEPEGEAEAEAEEPAAEEEVTAEEPEEAAAEAAEETVAEAEESSEDSEEEEVADDASLVAGEEAATEGAASDVTEDEKNAFNKTGESEEAVEGE